MSKFDLFQWNPSWRCQRPRASSSPLFYSSSSLPLAFLLSLRIRNIYSKLSIFITTSRILLDLPSNYLELLSTLLCQLSTSTSFHGTPAWHSLATPPFLSICFQALSKYSVFHERGRKRKRYRAPSHHSLSLFVSLS